MKNNAGAVQMPAQLWSLLTCPQEKWCRAWQRRGKAGTLTTRNEAWRCAAGTDVGPSDPDLGLAQADLYHHAIGQLSENCLLEPRTG